MSLPTPRLLAAAWAATLLSAPALAETRTEPAAPSTPLVPAGPAVSPVSVEVQSAASDFDAAAIEGAVRAELAETREPLTPGTRLLIRVSEKRNARVEVHASNGEVRTRELALPAERKSALEVLGLVSASLVRSDADTLAAALRAAKAPPPTPSEASSEGANGPAPAAQSESGAGAEPVAVTAAPAATASAPARAPSASAAEPQSAIVGDAAEAKPQLAQAPANLSIAHPLAVLPDSHEKDLGFELGLFYSQVGALHGFGANGLVLHSNQRADGLLVAGLWSDIGDAGSGATIAGIASRGAGAYEGFTTGGVLDFRYGAVTGGQVAGVWAQNEGTFGFQVGGVAALSHEVTGFQAGGVFTVSHELSGVQVGGVFSRAHVTEGLQTAGVFTDAHDLRGLQVAGVFASADDVVGLQTAGLVTVAEKAHGLGVAGLVGMAQDSEGARIAPVNVTRDLEGVQIGIVNVGRNVKGAQLGVVNVADRLDGYPIGLVNAVGNGRNQLLAWTGGRRMPINGGYRYLHAPESDLSVYTLFFIGVDNVSGEETYGPGAAVGMRGRVFGPDVPLFLEGDLLWRTETTLRDNAELVQATGPRLAVGVELSPWLALFAGVAPLLVIENDTVSGPELLDLPIAGVQVL